MWYDLALFVHVLGAIGLFSAVSLVVVAFTRMRHASTLEQIRDWAAVAQVAGKSLVFISLVILAPALYMVIVAWEFTTPWVLASLVTFVALAVLGATVSGRTIQQVSALAGAAPSGPVPDHLRRALLAPRLWLAEGIRLALLVGLLCLMTMKPDTLFSWLILAGMLLLGIILGVLPQRSPKPSSQKESLL
jgi:Predicted integral membrane protein (DUF2269)